jgi:GT2 family glycosyltransferase/glycosyltransferase involved in cell wall biosynthesis
MDDNALIARSTGPVTVLVVTYQSVDVLPACLRALAVETADIDELELVVVDNGSSDGTVAVIAATWPGALVVETGRNAGYAAAINAGLDKRRGVGPVLVLNPDTRLRPGCLARLLTSLDQPGVGIAAPRLQDAEGTTLVSLRREPTVRRAFGPALLGARADRFPAWSEVVAGDVYQHPQTADWATGAALLISPACLRAVGPWDESFFLYSEETDFCLRARDLGYALAYVPSAVAVHLGGESATDPDLWSILTVNRVRLARRRLGPVRGAAFAAAVGLNEAVRAARGRKTSQAALRVLLSPTSAPALLQEARARADAAPRRDPGPAPVVCFSAQDFWYHNRAHSDIQLMRRLATSRQVLLVNSIGLRMPLPGRSTQPVRRIARKAASMSKLLKLPYPELPGFAVLSPVVLPFYGSRVGRELNARAVAAQVRWACRRLGLEQPTAVVTIPTAVDVLPHLTVRGVVFNRSDKHSEFTETDQPLIRSLEDRLLRESDAIVYVSRQLMADEVDRTGTRASFLDHGVDLDHFAPAPEVAEPADLRGVPRPRVGFFGGLDDYVVDMDLLERVARELPEVQLVLVGDATCSMDRLTRLPNVTWLPRRPYEDIPAYGRSFDVAIMPWLQNDWIRSCNPIKLKEYLALGLPVVSTDFPEVRQYAEVLRVAGSPQEFVAMIRQTVADGGASTPAARRDAVSDSSWDAVADRLARTCSAVRSR